MTSANQITPSEVDTSLIILNRNGVDQSDQSFFSVNTSMAVVRQKAGNTEFIGIASSSNPKSRYLFSLKIDSQAQAQDLRPQFTRLLELDLHVCPTGIQLDLDVDNLYIASVCGKLDNHVFIVALDSDLKKASISRKIVIEDFTDFEICPLRSSFAIVDKKENGILLYSRSKPFRAVQEYPFADMGLENIKLISCDKSRNFV